MNGIKWGEKKGIDFPKTKGFIQFGNFSMCSLFFFFFFPFFLLAFSLRAEGNSQWYDTLFFFFSLLPICSLPLPTLPFAGYTYPFFFPPPLSISVCMHACFLPSFYHVQPVWGKGVIISWQ